jgi:hypothetical protein
MIDFQRDILNLVCCLLSIFDIKTVPCVKQDFVQYL